MLNSLYIENFTIIDKLEIDFSDGMNVLSGETGAGKSIVIDAIGQLSGNRSNTDLIKDNKDYFFIEGNFYIDNINTINLLKENDINLDDNQLIVSKKMNGNGNTTIKINYRTVSLSLLKIIMSNLIDIHNQFDNQLLFNEKLHIGYLDNYIGKSMANLKKEYLDIFNKYKSKEKELSNLISEEMSDEQLDFYNTQLKEIESFDFDNFDEDKLLEERKNLKDLAKNNELLNSYHSLMEARVLSNLKEAISYLDNIDNEDFKELDEKINDIYYALTDIDNEIDSYKYNLSFSKEREEEIFDTITSFNTLKRKYGNSVETILESKEELMKKIDNFSNREQYINDLNKELSSLKDNLDSLAKKIHNNRIKGKETFIKQITKELSSLYLKNVVFDIIIKEVEPNINGYDDVKFMISTNPGESLKPLKDIASGGEVSRIMMAIKVLFNNPLINQTMIFDEADTGVSGKVAFSMGNKMKELATNNQIICITHLAQVAAFYDHHYLISKSNTTSNTSVSVSKLNDEDSIKQIARLISGTKITDESLSHAKQLIEEARAKN
ncbi:MAG: DNA repair protein RecN [Thomasclavelia sp.]|nr:DNA repair protein RecN [Thomasclavelia sp.]